MGVDVVMVNKVLFVIYGFELFEVVDCVGVFVYYEVVVVGVIFIICLLCDLFVGDCVVWIMGIVNGIINYIFDCMEMEGVDFVDVLVDV